MVNEQSDRSSTHRITPLCNSFTHQLLNSNPTPPDKHRPMFTLGDRSDSQKTHTHAHTHTHTRTHSLAHRHRQTDRAQARQQAHRMISGTNATPRPHTIPTIRMWQQQQCSTTIKITIRDQQLNSASPSPSPSAAAPAPAPAIAAPSVASAEAAEAHTAPRHRSAAFTCQPPNRVHLSSAPRLRVCSAAASVLVCPLSAVSMSTCSPRRGIGGCGARCVAPPPPRSHGLRADWIASGS